MQMPSQPVVEYKLRPPKTKAGPMCPSKKSFLSIAITTFFLLARGVFIGATGRNYKIRFIPKDGKYCAFAFGKKRSEEVCDPMSPKLKKPLIIYEFESCPYCKKVRDALSDLSLNAYMYPCPKKGVMWRPQLVSMAGKAQFPYMIDPNTDTKMYESDAIVEYLYKEYGDGKVPWTLRLGKWTISWELFSMLPRIKEGFICKPSTIPQHPLTLWGYEPSPFTQSVRLVLCQHEIPYLYINCPRGSPKRLELFEKHGQFMAPYLEDPNTGEALFESDDIVEYIKEKYAA